MKAITLVSLSFLTVLWGCGPAGPTGAMEPEQLFNSAGLEGLSLFDADGVTVPAYSPNPFIRVGLMWDAEAGTELQGRVLDERGIWGRWETILPYFEEDLAHAGHLDVENGLGLGFQLRLSNGAEPLHVVVEAIERVGEPDAVPIAATETEGGFGELSQALAPSSLVHPRSDWGARAPQCSSGSHSPVKVTIHHTATPLPDSMTPKERLRQIQAYHMYTNGWCDIGYHLLVDWNGAAWQGRNEKVIGAHVANHNTGNVGLSYPGTYTSRSASSAQVTKGAKILKWLHDTYGIALNRDKIWGHRQWASTACPGNKLYAQLNGMVEEARTGNSGDDGGSEPAKGTLRGVVFVDKGQGTADMSTRLPGAAVKVAGVGSKTAESGDAAWSFSLNPDTYTVTATKDGYQSATRSCKVTSGDTTWCSIGLVRVPQQGILKGVVYEDQGSGVADMSKRLLGAMVTLSGNGTVTASVADGSWSKQVTAGSITATASYTGYKSASRVCLVEAGQETSCPIGLIKDTGDDPGTVDPDPTKGRLYGHVVVQDETLVGQDLDLGTPVPVASVLADTGEVTQADDLGYFEFWVTPGTREVRASAAGYSDGVAECTVAAGGEARCSIPLVPLPTDGSPEDEPVLVGGCSTTGAGNGLALLCLMCLGSLFRRRGR